MRNLFPDRAEQTLSWVDLTAICRAEHQKWTDIVLQVGIDIPERRITTACAYQTISEDDVDESSRLVVGGGYLGMRVAWRWRQAGGVVFVTTRSQPRAETLAREGYIPLHFDVLQPDTWSSLPDVAQVCYCIGYDAAGGANRHEVYVNGLKNFSARRPRIADRFVYISSTGVYAQANGEWVDERSVCQPTRDGGVACWEAENLLRSSALGERSVILRLAGIYGPGRIPYRDQLQRGEPLPVAAAGYLNLIHVEDAADIVVAAAACRLPSLFVVADGTPVRRADYYREVARCLGVEVSFTEMDPNLSQTQRALASKRINIEKLQRELPIKLSYPTYREGIAASLSDK